MSPTRGFVGAMGAYIVLLLVSVWVLSDARVAGSAWRFPIALLPVPAGMALVAVGVAQYRDLDELLRRIHLMGLAVGFLATLLTMFTWGFLEGVGAPRPSGFVVFGLLVAFYLVGLLWAQRRYR